MWRNILRILRIYCSIRTRFRRAIRIKRLFVIIGGIICILSGIKSPAWAYDGMVTAKYFYSPTCGSCHEFEHDLTNLKDKYPNLHIDELAITDLRNKRLLDSYCQAYRVPDGQSGTVPIFFLRDRYFTDPESLESSVNEIMENDTAQTAVIWGTSEYGTADGDTRLDSYKMMGVWTAGMVNGLNPCSLSMALTFFSLLMCRKKTVLKAGLLYCAGKFLSYILLGTIFFHFLQNLYFSEFELTVKIMTLVVLAALIVLNVYDFIAASQEHYNRIRLQLPAGIRTADHRFIAKISAVRYEPLILLMSFSLGMFISIGEFLCTGQIYLTTIVTAVQMGETPDLKALLFLVIYNLGFVLPTITVTAIIYKGKEIFEISDLIRRKLPVIKIINVVFFAAFTGILLFHL